MVVQKDCFLFDLTIDQSMSPKVQSSNPGLDEQRRTNNHGWKQIPCITRSLKVNTESTLVNRTQFNDIPR